MPSDDPFKNFGMSAVDRLIEEQRRRDALLEHISLPKKLLAERYQSVAAQATALANNSALIRMSEQAGRLQQISEAYQATIDRLSPWARLSAMQEASLAIAKQQAIEENRFGKLAIAMSEQLSALSSLGYNHTSLIEKAMQSSSVVDAMNRAGSFSQFQDIARQAQTISDQFERFAKEKAVWQQHTTIDAAIARHILEAQAAMDAIASEESADNFADHFGSLLRALGNLIAGLGVNTTKELRGMGFISLLAAMLSFLTIWDFVQPDDLSDAEREQFAVVQNNVREVREQLTALLADEAKLDEAFVADLPRGLTRRKAYIRVQPSRNGELVLILPPDTPVAVHERAERWLKVVYRDPLADQLAMGWVYGASIEVSSD